MSLSAGTPYLVIPLADTTHRDSGAFRGPAVKVTFKSGPASFTVSQRHWNKGWQPCEGKHCPWCLETARVELRFNAIVTDSEGTEHILQMVPNLYRTIKRWANHLGAAFTDTPLNIRRNGVGVETVYEVFQ